MSPLQETDWGPIQTKQAKQSSPRTLYLNNCGCNILLFSFSALVNFHLLDSVQCSEAILSGTSYETMEGSNVVIGCDGESLTVNGVKMVLKKDIVTTNGVIHLIDKVLMPDSG